MKAPRAVDESFLRILAKIPLASGWNEVSFRSRVNAMLVIIAARILVRFIARMREVGR